MKKLGILGACLAFAATAIAGGNGNSQLNGHWVHKYFAKGQSRPSRRTSGITYHGGPVLTQAKAVPIFWGSYWGSGTGASDANTMIAYLEQYGTNNEYAVITQYYDTVGGTNYIGASVLTSSASVAWYDSSNPPTAVTDADVQGEVSKYLGATGNYGAQTIYEVFIPPTSYSSDGGATSCGGPALQYCAYHSNYTSSHGDTKYAIEPYPTCSGCSSTGWSNMENLQHFVCHETREAVTDPDGNAWYDRSGNEADDKCAWSPNPFLVTGSGDTFGYQYEWSNSASGCVKANGTPNN